jgi:hypothetical protein
MPERRAMSLAHLLAAIYQAAFFLSYLYGRNSSHFSGSDKNCLIMPPAMMMQLKLRQNF